MTGQTRAVRPSRTHSLRRDPSTGYAANQAPHSLLQLQQLAGNRAVTTRLASLPPTLSPFVQRDLTVASRTFRADPTALEEVYAQMGPFRLLNPTRKDQHMRILGDFADKNNFYPSLRHLAAAVIEAEREQSAAGESDALLAELDRLVESTERAASLDRIHDLLRQLKPWIKDKGAVANRANFEALVGVSEELIKFPDLELERLANEFADQVPGGQDIDADDVEGVKLLVDDLELRYPVKEFEYITLGASADLLVVELERRGRKVHVIPLSAVPDWDTASTSVGLYARDIINLINAYVTPWPAIERQIVIFDVISSGSALTTAKRLCQMMDVYNSGGPGAGDPAQAFTRVDHQKDVPRRQIDLFGLNRPVTQAAAKRVKDKEIALPRGATPPLEHVMIRLHKQVFKEKYRLYQKNQLDKQPRFDIERDPLVEAAFRELLSPAQGKELAGSLK